MPYLTAVPAYGRDYKSAKAVKAAWAEGADFRINDLSSPDDGRYVNRDDKPDGTHLQVRFDHLTKVVIIN